MSFNSFNAYAINIMYNDLRLSHSWMIPCDTFDMCLELVNKYLRYEEVIYVSIMKNGNNLVTYYPEILHFLQGGEI